MAVYRETFVSPFVKETKAKAFKVLDEIRENFPSSKGWVEIDGFIEPCEGGWKAVRVHEKRDVENGSVRF